MKCAVGFEVGRSGSFVAGSLRPVLDISVLTPSIAVATPEHPDQTSLHLVLEISSPLTSEKATLISKDAIPTSKEATPISK